MSSKDQLLAFRAQDKFPAESWEPRGLIYSNAETRQRMNENVNSFIDLFLPMIEAGKPQELISSALEFLQNRNLDQFDTEEAEFIFDQYAEVMKMLEIFQEVRQCLGW